MMHGFQQIVTQAERRYNFVVHGLPPLGDEMGVSPSIWRKKLMDSISSNLDYILKCGGPLTSPVRNQSGAWLVSSERCLSCQGVRHGLMPGTSRLDSLLLRCGVQGVLSRRLKSYGKLPPATGGAMMPEQRARQRADD